MGFLLSFLILGNKTHSLKQMFCIKVTFCSCLVTIPWGDLTRCKLRILSEYQSFELDRMRWLSLTQQVVLMRTLTVIYGREPSRCLLLLKFGFWVNGENKEQPAIFLTECKLLKLCVQLEIHMWMAIISFLFGIDLGPELPPPFLSVWKEIQRRMMGSLFFLVLWWERACFVMSDMDIIYRVDTLAIYYTSGEKEWVRSHEAAEQQPGERCHGCFSFFFIRVPLTNVTRKVETAICPCGVC